METLSGRYRINHIIGEISPQTYHITAVPTERDFVYGNNITFDPVSSTFESYYTAKCGNDCFPMSRGTYKMEGEQHVRLFLTHVSQHGMCENYDRAVQNDLGVFLIKVNDAADGITLTFAEE